MVGGWPSSPARRVASSINSRARGRSPDSHIVNARTALALAPTSKPNFSLISLPGSSKPLSPSSSWVRAPRKSPSCMQAWPRARWPARASPIRPSASASRRKRSAISRATRNSPRDQLQRNRPKSAENPSAGSSARVARALVRSNAALASSAAYPFDHRTA